MVTATSKIPRYTVASYCGCRWCVVDTTKFLGEAQRKANRPMQVWEHDCIGFIGTFTDREEAQFAADKLNELDS